MALAAAVLSRFTYLMRRNWIAVINPHIEGGHIVGGMVHIAAPSVEDLVAEATDANVTATTLENNLATIIQDLRYQRQLAE